MKPIPNFLFLSSLVLFQTSLAQAQQTAATARTDQYGARLPEGASQRLGDLRHVRGSANSIAISPDGRLAALAHNDRMIYLWNLLSAQEVRQLIGHQGPVTAVAFAPDGSSLASASDDGTVRIWDTATGKERRCFAGHGTRVMTVAYSSNGTILASGGWDNKVSLWEPGTGKKLRELNVGARVNAVAFSVDDQTLAAGAYFDGAQEPVRVWDVATGMERFRFGHEHRTVNAVAFSPDGRTLASANDDDMIQLLEVATGRLIRNFQGHHGYVKSVAFSPDGRTLASAASGGKDFGCRLWEVATGQVCRQFHNPTGHTVAVAFTPNGKALISGGRDMTAVVWPLGRGEERRKPRASLSCSELEAMWETLKGSDASKAHVVIWEMVAAPEASLTFLRRRLRPAKQPAQVDARLIADLDSPGFKVRETAMAQLERLTAAAVPQLRQALARRPSVEASRRLELVLRKLEPKGITPDWLRTLRVLQILEQVGNRESRALLEALARGAPGAMLTQEARGALGRLDLRASAVRSLQSQP